MTRTVLCTALTTRMCTVLQNKWRKAIAKVDGVPVRSVTRREGAPLSSWLRSSSWSDFSRAELGSGSFCYLAQLRLLLLFASDAILLPLWRLLFRCHFRLVHLDFLAQLRRLTSFYRTTAPAKRYNEIRESRQELSESDCRSASDWWIYLNCMHWTQPKA